MSAEVQAELFEAIGDSPIVSAIKAASYLIVGWPLYLIRNASGQNWYPRNVNREHIDLCLDMEINIKI